MAFNFFEKFSPKKGVPKAAISHAKKDDVSAQSSAKPSTRHKKSSEIVAPVAVVEQSHGKNILANSFLVAPHISEKASMLQEVHEGGNGPSYVFRVANKSNKQLLKKAIEARYDVNVVSVRVINTSSKEVRRGKVVGHKPGYKKAIITLKLGDTIEQF